MRKQKRDQQNGIDYWQPSSDLMTGLLLILALIIALLLLFLIRVPDDDYDDYNSNSHTEENEDTDDVDDEHHLDHTRDHDETRNSNGGGNGGGGGDGHDDGDEPEEYPEGEPGNKSAVFVTLIDGETEKPILEKGVQFNLHSSGGAIQILNTYYPNKISYKEYETTDEGTYFLPEKIPQGRYYLKNLTEATGYDLADDTYFDVDQIYDWPDPLIVTVPVYPARNVIQINLTEKETEKAVGGATFTIYAAEDITTMDGTVRYQAGDKVGKIKCDENGEGESKELYLGKYEIRQKKIPEYYADIDESVEVTLERSESSKETTQKLVCEKTKIALRLTDELNETPIQGAEYIISDGETETRAQTDTAGRIILDEVKKNTTYQFTEAKQTGDYLLSKDAVSVTVSDKGRIDGETAKELGVTNRMIRTNFDIQDAVLKNALSDMSISMFDENDTIVKTWTTNGATQDFTDVAEGNYYIVVNGNEGKQFPVAVKDVKDIQNFTIKVWTVKSYLAVAFAGIVSVGALALLIVALRRLINKKRAKKNKPEE